MKLQLLAGGALVALLAGCGSDPVYYSDSYYPYARSYYYGESHPYARYPSLYGDSRYPTLYGDRVASIEVLNGSPIGGIVAGNTVPVPAAPLYRVTVHNANGAYETYVMESLGTLRVGDRVRVSNGTIYPIG